LLQQQYNEVLKRVLKDGFIHGIYEYKRREASPFIGWKAISYSVASKYSKYSKTPNILFKNQYNVEKYVELNIPKNVRSAMAMFLCGVLPLRIETGR
jgi:hypothetical protein